MKILRIAFAVVGAALALATAAPHAVAAPPGGDPGGATPQIIGGGTASNAPWAARLFVNGQQNCSATIIAPTYILTAKHCVASSGSYSFRIGSLDQTSGGTVANGVAITRHPRADIAIVRLDRSVSASYSPLGTSSNVAVGQTVQVYGWGATCTNQPEINCQSRYLKYANVRVTSVNCWTTAAASRCARHASTASPRAATPAARCSPPAGRSASRRRVTARPARRTPTSPLTAPGSVRWPASSPRVHRSNMVSPPLRHTELAVRAPPNANSVCVNGGLTVSERGTRGVAHDRDGSCACSVTSVWQRRVSRREGCFDGTHRPRC